MADTRDPYVGASLQLCSWGDLTSPFSRRFLPTFRFAFATSRQRISAQGSPGLAFIIRISGFFLLPDCRASPPSRTERSLPTSLLLLRVRILVLVQECFLSAGPTVDADLRIRIYLSTDEGPLFFNSSPDRLWVLRESPSPGLLWVLRVGPPLPSAISFVPASPILWIRSAFYVLIIQILPCVFSPACIFVPDVLMR